MKKTLKELSIIFAVIAGSIALMNWRDSQTEKLQRTYEYNQAHRYDADKYEVETSYQAEPPKVDVIIIEADEEAEDYCQCPVPLWLVEGNE